MDKLFPLEYQATIQAIYHRLWRGSGTMVMLVLCDGPPFDPPRLTAAVRQLLGDQPLLRTSISPDGSELRCSPLEPSRELAVPVEFLPESQDPLALAERQLADGLPAAAPLWRLTVASTAEDSRILCLTTHHSLTDAQAGVWLLFELLALIGTHRQGDRTRSRAGHAPANQSLLLPQPSPPQPGYQQRPAATAVPNPTSTATWLREAQAPIAQRSTRLIQLVFPPQLAPMLRERCRRERTTVHAAVMAALLVAASQHQSLRGLAPLTTAVDLRNRLPPPAGAIDGPLGCRIAMLKTLHPVPPAGTLWDLARLCGQTLQDRLSGQTAQGFAPPRFKAELLAQLMRNTLGQADERGCFPDGPAISNLGVIAPPVLIHPYTVRSLHFTVVQHAGLHLLFLSLSTTNGRLNGWLSFTQPLLTHTTAQAIAADFTKELINGLSLGH